MKKEATTTDRTGPLAGLDNGVLNVGRSLWPGRGLRRRGSTLAVAAAALALAGCSALMVEEPSNNTVVVTSSGASASPAARRAEAPEAVRTTAPPAKKADTAVARSVTEALDAAAAMADAGDEAGALAALQAAVAQNPESLDLVVAQGDAALALGDKDIALASYRQATAIAVTERDLDGATAYNELLSELAGEPPQWVIDAEEAASGFADEAAAGDALEQWEFLQESVGAALDAGDAGQARQLSEQLVDLAEASFGENHLLTILSLRSSAEAAFAEQDDFGAESLLILAQERATETLGAGHPETVAVAQDLAQVYASVGNIERAVEVYAELEEPLAEGLGADSPLALSVGIDRARALERAGFFDEGADLLEATCASYGATLGAWHPDTADCFAALGGMLGGAGDLDAAEAAYAQALRVNAGILPPTAVDAIFLEAEAAEILRLQGRFDEAITIQERAQDRAATIAASTGDDALLMEVNGLLARSYEDLGRFDDALGLHFEVLEYRLDTVGPDAPETLAAVNFVAGAQSRMGNLTAAEEGYQQALNGYRLLFGDEDPATIAVMNNLGVALEQMGVYDEAEPLLRSALTNAESILGPAHPTTLRNMNNLALLYESQGTFDRAEPLYALPVQVLAAELGEEHPDTVAVANNLAFLNLMRQDYVKAATGFERAAAAWDASLGADHQNTLKARNNLGRAFLGQARNDEAAAVFEETLALRTDVLGDTHIDTLRSMQDLGRAFLAQGRLSEAEGQLRKTLELSEAELGAEHPYTFETLNALADALGAQDRAEEEFELRREGYRRRTKFLDRMLWVTSENAREGYVRLHRPELDRYLGSLPELTSVVGGRELLDVALQRKGILLRIASEVQQIAALQLDPTVSQLADQLVESRKELAAVTLAGPQDETGDQHLRRVRTLESQVEELEAELGRASVLFRESVAELSVNDLVDALPEDATLIDFLVTTDESGQETLLAGVLTKQGGVPGLNLVSYDYAEIADGIDEYREAIQDEGGDDEETKEIGMDLYDLLWAPLADSMGAGAVYVVPDGQLNILPFDALPNEDGEYLLQTTDLHMLSSSRDLLPTQIVTASGEILLLAGPDYDTEETAGPEVLAEARSRQAIRRSRGASAAATAAPDAAAEAVAGSRGRGVRLDTLRGVSMADIDSRSAVVKASLRAASAGMRGLTFLPLPGAEREGRLIDAQIQKSGLPKQFYTKIAAEESILAEMDEPPRVLHIATHGFFLKPNDQLRQRLLSMQRGADLQVPPPGDNPLLRAGLAFAGINSNAPFFGEIDTANDGVLTALEVLGLNLTGTELAVLSACETGLGEVHFGEGVYGLRRAFKEAGVEEIVMSLWEVSDAGTQALMTEMYSRLLAGASPREALRGAQKVLLEDPRWGYPYIWAAFTVVGK